MRSCRICQSTDRAPGRILSILRDIAIFFLSRDVAFRGSVLLPTLLRLLFRPVVVR
jgi:hypothetical protein